MSSSSSSNVNWFNHRKKLYFIYILNHPAYYNYEGQEQIEKLIFEFDSILNHYFNRWILSKNRINFWYK